MKKTKLNCILALACATAVFSAFSVSAEVSTQTIEKTLKAVRAPELPAKAASLVSKAKTEDREATTIAAVKTAIGINRASAAAVVGAIAHANPKMASVAAATAVSLEPKQAAKIARAAASGAPSEADAIVAAMSKAAPSFSNAISENVASTISAGKTLASVNGFDRAPTVGDPFVDRVGGTGEISHTNTVVVPPGGRDYSAP